VTRLANGITDQWGDTIYVYSVEIDPHELTAGETFWINIVNHSPTTNSWAWRETANAGNPKQARGLTSCDSTIRFYCFEQ
jgi:hypothetical protein